MDHSHAPETLAERITSNTPLMLAITLTGAVCTIGAVATGYYFIFLVVKFIGN